MSLEITQHLNHFKKDELSLCEGCNLWGARVVVTAASSCDAIL